MNKAFSKEQITYNHSTLQPESLSGYRIDCLRHATPEKLEDLIFIIRKNDKI
jgi:hypothetical protein